MLHIGRSPAPFSPQAIERLHAAEYQQLANVVLRAVHDAWPSDVPHVPGCNDVQDAVVAALVPPPAAPGLREALKGIPQGVRPSPGLSSVAGWNRYDTDDELVLHLWANDQHSPGGQSWDVRIPKAALAETPREPRETEGAL